MQEVTLVTRDIEFMGGVTRMQDFDCPGCGEYNAMVYVEKRVIVACDACKTPLSIASHAHEEVEPLTSGAGLTLEREIESSIMVRPQSGGIMIDGWLV